MIKVGTLSLVTPAGQFVDYSSLGNLSDASLKLNF